MGAEGSEGIDGTEAEGTGAVVGGAGGTDAETEGDGAGGSSVCSSIGGRSSSGISTVGWSSSGPGDGRRKARGMACHRSTVRVASQPRRHSNRGSSWNSMCSSTWHKSCENRRGVDSARGKIRRWTLSSKWNKAVMISSAGLNQ